MGDIEDNGGDVRYLKESGSHNVDVLWIQTRDMRSQLCQTKPQVFECDTTFGTQVEGYKLYIPLFHSNHSDMWEVAGLLFLSTETKETVEEGLKFFKASLPYKIEDGVTRFIFFTDKDFDYIQVIILYDKVIYEWPLTAIYRGKFCKNVLFILNLIIIFS